MLNSLLAGVVVGFGVCCVVVGLFGGFKIVQWIGKKLELDPWDVP